MEFNEILNRRYSCRAFAAQGVEQEKVDRILEAGRMAPTAVNKQPLHIWAVSRPETLEAENEGLATLWVGSFDPALLRDILPGAEGYELVAMINVGYPAPDSKPSAMHGERKAVRELVTRVE